MPPGLSVEHQEAGSAYRRGPVRSGAGLCGALQSLGTEYGKMGHTEEPYIPFQRVLAMNYLPGSSPSKYFRHCKA